MTEFSEKLVKKLLFVLSEAIRIILYALLSAILVFPLTLALVSSPKDHQVIVLISVFLSLLFAYKIRDWIPNNNRFMKISCEVMTFLFSEIATWILLYVYLDEDEEVKGKEYFKTFNAYLSMYFWLMSVLNSLIHSVLIYHLIRGNERSTLKYMTTFRAFYVFVGTIILYGSVYLLFTPKLLKIANLISLSLLIDLNVMSLEFGGEGKIIRKYFDINKWFGYIVIFMLINVLLAIVIVINNSTLIFYIPTTLADFSTNYDAVYDFSVVNFSLWRLIYLKWRIEPASISSTLSEMREHDRIARMTKKDMFTHIPSDAQ